MTLPTLNADESSLKKSGLSAADAAAASGTGSREQSFNFDDRLLFSRKDGGPMPTSDAPEAPQHFHESSTDAAKECRVCGDNATGMYFGALVCVPCKTFFLRYAGDGFCYECKYNKNCQITVATRTQCKYCRYQKCLRIGMCRRVRPVQVEALEGQQLCAVCQDVANGVHFGVLTCEGCKKFFRRGLTEQKSYRCRNNQNCSINPSNRNSCRFCRFKKCLDAGMSRDAIQMGRPSKMTTFDVHQRTHSKENEKHTRELKRDPLIVHQSSPYANSTAVSNSTVDRNHKEFVSGSRLPTVPPRFPSWTQEAAPLQSADQRNGAWNAYENLAASRQGWSINRSRFSHTTASPEDAERDFNAFPDSTVTREEPDSFLANLRSSMTTSSGEWSKEEDYFHNWTEMADSIRSVGPLIGLRETLPPVGVCKVEALSSSDDEGPSGQKRGRFDLLTQDYRLQSNTRDEENVDVQMKCPLFSDKMEPFLGMGHIGIDDVTSSELAMSFEIKDPMTDALGQSAPYSGGVSAFGDQFLFLPVTGSSHAPGQVTRYVGHRIGSPSVTSSSGSFLELKKSELNDLQPARQMAVSSAEHTADHADTRICSGDRKDDHETERKVTKDQCGSFSDSDHHNSDEDVGSQCWHTIQRIIPAYHRFVTMGTSINQQLKEAYEKWKKENVNSGKAEELSSWIQTTVVPAYTTVSIAYCKSLPDFTHLNANDQRTLIASGQSQSRILVAALHWFDVGERKFRNFLSWREDSNDRRDPFKEQLREFADHITALRIDPIEAALLNALTIFSTDYPNLTDRRAIDVHRSKILTTMKAYTTANNASPNSRMEELQDVLDRAKDLGLIHVALTTTRSLGIATSTPSTGLQEPDGTRAHRGDSESEHARDLSEMQPKLTENIKVESRRERQLVDGRRGSGESSDENIKIGELTSNEQLISIPHSIIQAPSDEMQSVQCANRRPSGEEENLQDIPWMKRHPSGEKSQNLKLTNGHSSEEEDFQNVEQTNRALKVATDADDADDEMAEAHSPLGESTGLQVPTTEHNKNAGYSMNSILKDSSHVVDQ